MTPTEIVIREEILRRLARGEGLRAICRDQGFPDESTVRVWAVEDADFAPRYARARQTGYAKLADEILEIADNTIEGEKRITKREQLVQFGQPVMGTETEKTEVHVTDMTQHRQIQIDARKWLLSKMLPKQFGDKLQQEISGVDGGPIKTESLNVLAHDPIAASQAYQAFMEGK